MKYNNYSFTKEANSYYDEGLRAYMLSIYQNMSLALGISALVAYIVGNSTPSRNYDIYYPSCICCDVCAAYSYFFSLVVS